MGSSPRGWDGMECWVALVAQLLGVTDTGLWLSFSHLLPAARIPPIPSPFL